METYSEFYKSIKYKKLPTSSYFDIEGNALGSFKVEGIYCGREFTFVKKNIMVDHWVKDTKISFKSNVIRKLYDGLINNDIIMH